MTTGRINQVANPSSAAGGRWGGQDPPSPPSAGAYRRATGFAWPTAPCLPRNGGERLWTGSPTYLGSVVLRDEPGAHPPLAFCEHYWAKIFSPPSQRGGILFGLSFSAWTSRGRAGPVAWGPTGRSTHRASSSLLVGVRSVDKLRRTGTVREGSHGEWNRFLWSQILVAE